MSRTVLLDRPGTRPEPPRRARDDARRSAVRLRRTSGRALRSRRERAEEELAGRARQQAAVAALGLSALRGAELQDLLEEAVILVARTLGADHCKVMQLVEPDTLLLRAGFGWRAGQVGRYTTGLSAESPCGYSLRSGAPIVVEDFATDARFPSPPQLLHEHGIVSAASVLIRDRHGTFGVLGAYTRSRRAFGQDDLDFLQSVANVLATTVERHRVEDQLRDHREQLQALSRRLLEAQEAERRAVARDLHDELGQLLTALKMDLRWLERRLGALDPAERSGAMIDRAVAASSLVDQTVRTVQRMAADLRSGPLERLGLGSALGCEGRRFQERTGISCEVRLAEQLPELPMAVATALYRIAQEALTNVARHAGAQRVVILLRAGGSELALRIQDDGRGIDDAAAGAGLGLGLLGMHERASMLGGHVKIARGPAGGTVVTTRVPLAPTAVASPEVAT
ncbi:GAF domain-containing sensor histidine kinase [Anaeromyxobacter oryzae]|uniref:Oxygen sensor histidine kinase NreB n=1 Tax=Anaeromyxobacter oryzae TaxID=2918170 RepID=A0ABM7X1G8_9BACT|nr:GAF domain-containing sensor histidine kinase [Anaeromyxobacter oryzae]BDG05590.1 hypothetical protein AMOR_45860 [Anaeromyxobacter oryzae]